MNDDKFSQRVKEGMDGLVKKSSRKAREIMEEIDDDDLYVLNEREAVALELRSGQQAGEVMRYREIGDVMDLRPQEARVYVQSGIKKLEKLLKAKECYW